MSPNDRTRPSAALRSVPVRLLTALVVLGLLAPSAAGEVGSGPSPSDPPAWSPLPTDQRTTWSRVSVAPDGSQLSDASMDVSVAAGGRTVFRSYASEYHEQAGIYGGVWMYEPGQTGLTLVSVDADGQAVSASSAPALSPSGRFLAYASYVYEEPAPESDGGASALGMYATTGSYALMIRDLGTADSLPAFYEIPIGASEGWIGGVAVADDGTVAYVVQDGDGGGTYHRTVLAGGSSVVGDAGAASYATPPAISPDGTRIAFARFVAGATLGADGRPLGTWTLEVHDVAVTGPASLPLGTDAGADRYFGVPDFADDDTLVYTPSTDHGSEITLVDLSDMASIATTPVPVTHEPPVSPLDATITSDGRLIAFGSPYFDGTKVHEQLFVLDVASGTAQLATHGPDGLPATGAGDYVFGEGEISPDGTTLALATYLDTLVAGDTNLVMDVYAADLVSPTPGPQAWDEAAAMTVTDTTSTTVSLSWPASTNPDISGYELKRNGAIIATLGRDETTYTVTGLASGTASTYRVRGTSSSGYSRDSLTAVGATDPAGDGEVGLVVLTAEEADDGSVVLTWPASADPAVTGYRIDRSTEERTPTTVVPDLAPGATTWTDVATEPWTYYEYRVVALLADSARDHSATAGITTSSLQATGLTLQDLPYGRVPAGSAFTPVLTGTPKREAEVDLRYHTYFGDAGDVLAAPREVVDTVELVEDADVAGRYRHTATVPATVDALLAAKGRLSTAAGTSAEVATWTSLPVTVVRAVDASTTRGVELSWPPVASTAVTDYRVMRSVHAGPFTLVGTVAAGTTGFADRTVAGGSSYRYRIDVIDGDGDVAPWATSGDVYAPLTVIRASRVERDDPELAYLAKGEKVRFVVEGTPGVTGEVIVSTRTWRDEDGRYRAENEGTRPADVTVPLTEDTTAPGTYRGVLTVDDDLHSVEQLVAVLVDGGATRVTSRMSTWLPAAESVLSVVVPDRGALAGAVLAISSYGAPRREVVLTGPGTHVFGGVVGQTNASLTSVHGDWLDSQSLWGQSKAGRNVVLTLQPADIRQLRVTLKDPDGEPYQGYVEVTEPATGAWLGSGYASAAGLATLQLRGRSGEGLPATANVRVRAPWDQPWLTIDEGIGLPRTPSIDAALQFVRPAKGVLTGQVTLPDAAPTTGLRVTITQPQVGTYGHSATTRVGADGTYAVPSYAGPSTVVVEGPNLPQQRFALEVPVTGSATEHIALVAPVTFQVLPDVLVQDLDAPATVPSRELLESHVLDVFVRMPWGHSRGWTGGALRVAAYPGTTVDLCGRPDHRTGYAAACTSFALPDDATSVVEPQLVLRAPARISGRVEFDGQPARWSNLVVRDDRGSQVAYTYINAADGSFELPLASADVHTLEISQQTPKGQVQAVRDLSVLETGMALDLGTITLRAHSGHLSPDSLLLGRRRDVAPGALAPFEARLRLRAGANAGTGAVLVLAPPTGGEPVPGTLVIGGNPATPDVADDGTWTVALPPLATSSFTTVTWGVRAGATSERVVASGMVRSLDGTESTLTDAGVGVVGVTLSAPASTAARAITVKGRAPAGELVEIRDGSTVLGAIAASQQGFYRTVVTLPERGDRSTHRLVASTLGASPLSSEAVTVDLDVNEPQMSRITVSQPGRKAFSWDPRDGVAQFPYVFAPYLDLVVDVEFTDPAAVESATVFIGEESFEAVFDETSGRFSGSIRSVGRGGIRVEYVLKALTPITLPEVELTEAQVAEGIAAAGAAITSSETLDDGTLVVEGQLAEGAGGTDDPATFTSTLKVQRVENFEPTAGGRGSELGVPVHDLSYEFVDDDPNDGKVTLVTTGIVQFDGSKEAPAYVGDAAAAPAGSAEVLGAPSVGGFVAMSNIGQAGALAAARFEHTMEVAAAGLKKELTPNPDFGMKGLGLDDISLDAVAGAEMGAISATGASGKYGDVELMWDQLAECPESPMKDMWRRRLERLNNTALAYDLFSAGLGVAGMVVGGPLGGWTGNALGAAIDVGFGRNWNDRIDNATAGMMADCQKDQEHEDTMSGICETDRELIAKGVIKGPLLSFCKKYPPRKRPRGVPGSGPQGSPVWLHDPSGFVYEGMASNRVEGVTATLLYAPTETGPWTAWEAEAFEQMNPLVTDAEGMYAWDVPEGFWQVVWEAPGFETAHSDILEVLPPHFDVHAGLLATAAPAVASVSSTAGIATVTFDRPVLADNVVEAGLIQLRLAADGTPVPATVVASDPEEAPSYEKGPDQPYAGELLARTFTVTPVPPVTASTAVEVVVSGVVQGYNERPVGEDSVHELTLTPAPTGPTGPTGPTDPPTGPTGPSGPSSGTAGGGTASGVVVPGGTVRTGDPALPVGPADPLVVSVTSPAAGRVTIEEGAGTGPARTGFRLLGRHVTIESPDAPAGAWLTIRFRIDGSVLGDVAAGDLVVLRDGVGVGACEGDGLEPDPCVVMDMVGDDLVIEVRSSHASVWQFGVPGCDAPAFDDVGSANVHAGAIACAVAEGLARGLGGGRYGPSHAVSRAQAASFIARLVEAAGGELPDTPRTFSDVPADHAHAASIGRLAAAGILQGVGGGRFAPQRTLTRGQMATLLTAAVAHVTGAPLPAGRDAFEDDDGTAHEAAIDRAAAAGIARGKAARFFDPDGDVRRDQMATFLVNALRVAGES